MKLKDNLFLEDKLVSKANFAGNGPFSRDQEELDEKEETLDIRVVIAEQRKGGEKFRFKAFEIIGYEWGKQVTKEVLKYHELDPHFFSISIIEKPLLRGKEIGGDFVLLDRDDDYVVAGLKPSDILRLDLYKRKKIGYFEENVIYVPRSKLKVVR